MSTTLLELDQKLLEAIGDWLQHLVTTAITNTAVVVSTHLTKYRAVADYYNGFYCYVEDYNNEGDHYITDDDGVNTLTSFDTFVVEAPTTNKATFRLSRFPWADRMRAIDTACRQIYPDLFKYLDNTDLITGNILPPFNWSTTALLDIYTEPTGTLLKTTDGDYIRRGSTSAKITSNGSGNDVLVIDSTDYPRLLDVMGKTIKFKDWAYPVDNADDAFLTIQYTESDGTSTTVNSTTTCATGYFTLLEKEQAIPDDIVQIQFRMRVLTTLKNVYFDQPRVTGANVTEYLLPSDFQNGMVSRVYVQASSYSDDACDDLHPILWEEVYGFKVIDDGTYKYLQLPLLASNLQIRLIGYCPLETLDDDADTITPEGKELDLLTAYAAHLLYEIQNGKFVKDIDAKTSSIATIDTEIATEDTAITAIATDIANVVSQIDTELSAVSTVASEDISRYDAKIGRLDGKKKRLEDKRDALQDKRERLIVEKTALDFDIKRLDDRKARMEHESYEWLAKYRMLLPTLRMTTPAMSMRLRGLNGN